MSPSPALPIPDRLIVLTFDDAVSNHATLVGPMLKKHRFGATFYVCEFPPDFETNKQQYMDWEQIQGLSDEGFEIGNHTGHHAWIVGMSEETLTEEIHYIERRCQEYNIPRPTTFCYPGGGLDPAALSVLEKNGYRFARMGADRPYIPAVDNPLLAPSFKVDGEDSAPFYNAVAQARDGNIVVLMFHGVPEYTHPWVNTPPERFEEYMNYLADQHYTVIAMRDMARYIG